MGLIVVGLVCRWIRAREDSGQRRSRKGPLGDGIFEDNRAVGQCSEVGRSISLVAIEREMIGSQRVDGEQDDVGRFRRQR